MTQCERQNMRQEETGLSEDSPTWLYQHSSALEFLHGVPVKGVALMPSA